MAKCPVCHFSRTVVSVEPVGFLEKLALKLRVGSYFCIKCQRGFHRFSFHSQKRPTLRGEEKQIPPIPAQSTDFNEVVNELRKAEERLRRLAERDPQQRRIGQT